jgi:hypothetical protein
MLKEKNKKKTWIILGVAVLLIPVILPFFTVLIDIFLNLGRYFGTIARNTSAGFIMKNLFL